MKSTLRVVTPAWTQDLIRLDDLKADLAIEPTLDPVADAARDALLARRITEASLAAAAYCRRTFQGKSELLSEDVVETFRLGGDPPPESIKLRRWPTTAISSIVESGIAGDDVTLDPATDYELDGESGLLTRLLNDRPTRWRFVKLEVSYTGGLPPSDIPPNLQQAVTALARIGWFERARDPMITRRDIPNVISESFWVGAFKGSDGGVPLEIASLLTPFIEPVL